MNIDDQMPWSILYWSSHFQRHIGSIAGVLISINFKYNTLGFVPSRSKAGVCSGSILSLLHIERGQLACFYSVQFIFCSSNTCLQTSFSLRSSYLYDSLPLSLSFSLSLSLSHIYTHAHKHIHTHIHTWWWWWLVFCRHLCAHGRLDGPSDFIR